jgi:hypothetical protein
LTDAPRLSGTAQEQQTTSLQKRSGDQPNSSSQQYMDPAMCQGNSPWLIFL